MLGTGKEHSRPRYVVGCSAFRLRPPLVGVRGWSAGRDSYGDRSNGGRRAAGASAEASPG